MRLHTKPSGLGPSRLADAALAIAIGLALAFVLFTYL